MSKSIRPRTSAYLLLSCCVLGSLAIAHHPTLHHAGGANSAAFAHLGVVNATVHAGMIALMLGIALCFADYTAARAPRALNRNAMMLFGFGTISVCFAALVNGFIVPDVLFANPSSVDDGAARALLSKAFWAVNQRLMALGALSIVAAVAMWSWDLLFSGAKLRWLGALGLGMALLEVIWQLTQSSRFDLHNMQLFWGWFCLWCGLAAWVMLSKPCTSPGITPEAETSPARH